MLRPFPKLTSILLAGLLASLPVYSAEAPPEVESALRSRVSEFYQLQLDHKFRQAEQLVANDTKDFYYESKKSDLGSFNITGIEYSDEFHTAKVSMKSRVLMPFPGIAPIVMDVPYTSNWKIDDGKWCYYFDQTGVDTPFGRMKAQKADLNSETLDRLAKVKNGAFMAGVVAEPTTVQFSQANPVPATFTLKNTLPGPVTLDIPEISPALQILLGKASLAADESTTATLTLLPGAKQRPSQVIIQVGPLAQLVQIGIEYTK